MGKLVRPNRLKIYRLVHPGSSPGARTKECAYSLMVKQWSHKPPSLGSIPSGRTKRLEQVTLGINI